ncbi:hypothetical protein PHLGIDRAFT_188653 [Phlebiopsis gigantea 11061_1 CR5-6]|uniref:BTB domain-containing protein n=1 Tax=Phlebiopsis gigantea (strain 11061_1 CR5-6) TaxID=745531 RepID=A0A0C3S3U2_PHLG1|nr:hypothetical protein PHLGIDRAFT_188653 [Phlebiopsis gigantea 11061_1 CR5-6]
MGERLDVTSSPAPAELCQVHNLWFEDGNVVLQAQNNLFKVYRGILSRESAVFEDMFSLPQPDTQSPDSDIYDGCQLVKMHDDPSDLGHFLNCLFDFEYLTDIDCCLIYTVVLRLATKYEATALRKRVVKILQFVYPDELKLWDEVRNAGDYFPESHPLTGLWLTDFASHIAVVNAARETDTLILLPAAMYAIFMKGASWIVTSKTAAELSNVNKDALLASQPAIAKLSRRHSFALLYGEDSHLSAQCQSSSRCSKNRRKLTTRLELSALGYIIEPFHQIPFTPGTTPANFCTECRTTFKASYESGRQAAWEALPRAFGLPSWEKMQKAKEDENEEDEGMEEDKEDL